MNTTPVSKKVRWISYVLSALPVLMLLMSGVTKISQIKEVVEGFAKWPPGSAIAIGVLQIACTIVYLIPRTAVLGAILLTGYLGGAVAVTVEQGLGIAGWWLPATLGILLWGGLWLRETRVRALIPLRS